MWGSILKAIIKFSLASLGITAIMALTDRAKAWIRRTLGGRQLQTS